MRAFLLALLLGAAPAALARESKLPLDNRLAPVSRPAQWGLGVTLGEPFGLSLKRYLGGANAWDFNVALAYGPGCCSTSCLLFDTSLSESASKSTMGAC
jgi:hypothetical protein